MPTGPATAYDGESAQRPAMTEEFCLETQLMTRLQAMQIEARHLALRTRTASLSTDRQLIQEQLLNLEDRIDLLRRRLRRHRARWRQ